MIDTREGDSQFVAHARRELQMAGLFDKDEKSGYDGFIGTGALALAKLFDKSTNDDPAKIGALQHVFSFIVAGDLLSPPTNDPDEWEEFAIEGTTGLKNKRNQFYISQDDLKTWKNIRTGQVGVIQDHVTGKPLEGVTINDGTSTAPTDQEGTADASDTTDGGDASQSESTDGTGTSSPESEGDAKLGREESEPVEGGQLNAGVEPQGGEDTSEAKTTAEEQDEGKA